MKKLLGIIILGLLLVVSDTQAKNVDVGNGINIDIPENYKYFQINYKKLKNLLVKFPNLKKQIKSKDFKESLEFTGVGKNSKLTILVENQEAFKLVKKLSTSKGITKIIKEFESLTETPMSEFIEKAVTPDILKKLEGMSSKKEMEEWFEKWLSEPNQDKIITQITTDALNSLIAKYKIHKYAMVITFDKKMDNDAYNDLQTLGKKWCVFDFKCKNNKDVEHYIVKEMSNLLKEEAFYEDYSIEFIETKIGINNKNSLFFYTKMKMENDMSNLFFSKGELLASTKNEKLFFATSSCSENCDNFFKITNEIFDPIIKD